MKTVCKKCGAQFTPTRGAKGTFCSLKCWARSKDKADVNRKALKGKRLSLEHRRKLSKVKIGTIRSLESRKRNSESMIGHKWSKETIRKRTLSLTGKKRTGLAYQNILDGIAKSHGYNSYAEMPNVPNPDYRGHRWTEIRTRIIERDKNKCRLCGEKQRLQVHHIVPWRQTKDNSSSNLITLCISCHQSIKGKPLPI